MLSRTRRPSPARPGRCRGRAARSAWRSSRARASPRPTRSRSRARSSVRTGRSAARSRTALADGTYTARARQTNSEQEKGYSPPSVFTIGEVVPEPTPTPTPDPHAGSAAGGHRDADPGGRDDRHAPAPYVCKSRRDFNKHVRRRTGRACASPPRSRAACCKSTLRRHDILVHVDLRGLPKDHLRPARAHHADAARRPARDHRERHRGQLTAPAHCADRARRRSRSASPRRRRPGTAARAPTSAGAPRGPCPWPSSPRRSRARRSRSRR